MKMERARNAGETHGFESQEWSGCRNDASDNLLKNANSGTGQSCNMCLSVNTHAICAIDVIADTQNTTRYDTQHSAQHTIHNMKCNKMKRQFVKII